MASSVTPAFIEKNKAIVLRLAQCGNTDKDIGFIIGVKEGLLRIHFRDQLDLGRAEVRSSLRKVQIELALKERNPTMLIWLGKNMLGQREPKHNIEHSGSFAIEKVMFSSSEEVLEDKSTIEIEEKDE